MIMKKNLEKIYRKSKRAIAVLLAFNLCAGLIAVPDFAGREAFP